MEIRKPGLDATDPGKSFTFDTVYDWNSKQSELYLETFSPLVDSVLRGFNGTIFAYGQTGTGKTHTMEGDPRTDPGVIPRSFAHIFDHIAGADQNQQYLVRASYLEIYQVRHDFRLLVWLNFSNHFQLRDGRIIDFCQIP